MQTRSKIQKLVACLLTCLILSMQFFPIADLAPKKVSAEGTGAELYVRLSKDGNNPSDTFNYPGGTAGILSLLISVGMRT